MLTGGRDIDGRRNRLQLFIEFSGPIRLLCFLSVLRRTSGYGVDELSVQSHGPYYGPAGSVRNLSRFFDDCNGGFKIKRYFEKLLFVLPFKSDPQLFQPVIRGRIFVAGI